jgi:polyhydroxyalkanoate synthesis regulator phasin
VPHLSHKSESTEPVADISSETLDETFKINEEFMRSMSISLDEIKEENVQLTEQIQELEERVCLKIAFSQENLKI